MKDLKFEIKGNQIVKITTGEAIPEDEPIMIFRARDRLAFETIGRYLSLCIADGCTDYQIQLVRQRLQDFHKFAEEHPERMKQPGITKGS